MTREDNEGPNTLWKIKEPATMARARELLTVQQTSLRPEAIYIFWRHPSRGFWTCDSYGVLERTTAKRLVIRDLKSGEVEHADPKHCYIMERTAA